MFVIRWILGRIILLLNAVFAPKPLTRTAEAQAHVAQKSQALSLYQYPACPFCVKVRRTMRRQNLPIQTVNAKQDEHKQVLVNHGGKLQVPCLRIEKDGQVQWLYESSTIINYLNDEFA
ncbi:glutaredoxin [Shewanella denitrificans OS217]|jgi:glutaredoxin|uniref:Glutaredoxin n=1 Tax=Shewanella denitrificans (strain OS217 / ATCC BAA-1090 / DSM 15013) TaxID=318161 RepID=Q12MN8_SHEDO|nr:glutathione S-transferase N-terminal domain-containing protein [Shewanella denitrificans]ABE55288.1 glutaredoxin [Shewanella denitrificans OS217]